MLRSWTAELLKLRKRPAVWAVAGIWLVLMTMFTEIIPYVRYRSANARVAPNLLHDLLPAQLPGHAISGYPIWGGALILVLGGLALGSEYGWGTLKTTLIQGPGRLRVYATQLAALVTVVALLALVAFALCAAASVAIASAEGGSTAAPAAVDVLRALGAGGMVLTMWCMLGACLAIVFRNLALPIGLGMAWGLVVENLVGATASFISALGTVQKGLPGANAASLVSALGGGEPGGTGVSAVVGGGQGALVVGIYLVVFVVAGGVLLRRRDVQ
jgi:ABC-2 type transport system permease protein